MIRRNGTLVLLVMLLMVVVAGSVVAASGTFEAGFLPGRTSLASQPHRLFATSANLGIIEIDPDTGAILNTFSAPVQQSVSDGLAFDGTTLYYLSGNWAPNTLYALNPDTGAVETTYTLPDSAFRDGLAYLNGMIYILDWSVLTQQLTIFDPDSGSVIGVLDIDAANPDPPSIKGGLAGITAPDALLVTASDLDDEVLEIDPNTGLITHRFTHSQGSGVEGAAVVNGQIYLGANTSSDLTIYLRDGTPQGSITIPGSIGIQSLGGDDTTLMAISKAVIPSGKVNIGDLLTYTLSILATPGSELGLYDPLDDTTFLSFLPPPVSGIVHQDGVVTGSLTVSPTSQVTVAFVVQVPEGAGPTISNRACIYVLPGTPEWCEWSNEVVNDVWQPPGIPVLLSPADETVTTTQAITFTWQAGAGETPDGYNLKLDGQVITTTDTTSSTFLSLGVHTWTVRAYNSAGTSDWASARTVEVVPPAPGVPNLLFPPDETVTTTQAITFAWQSGAGGTPDGYNLNLDGEVLTTTATTLSTDLPVGLHSWTVRAYNAGGYSDWASARTIERISHWVYLPVVLRNYP